jgi:methionyl aminopeptidase
MRYPTVKKSAVEIKTQAELSVMRKAGELAGRALNEVMRNVVPGITTKELDKIGNSFIRQHGGQPTFVGYRGYPAAICVSINEEVVHGIPGGRKLKAGDIVSVDIAATLDGFVGDTARTVLLAPGAGTAQRLLDVTRASLDAAIDVMRAGNRLGDVGARVQSLVESNGFGVIREYVGHGIGRRMHEEPPVPNYAKAGTGIRLEPGMVLAIEPMVTAGDWRTRVLDDGWTVVTQDGSLAAHFEHTIAVTERDPLVLTDVD